ncbi:hypothetical protein OIU78_026687 [Salix suchowensis]|nr:hypothetical protein OIU78_026687 [Salix suchowensis]
MSKQEHPLPPITLVPLKMQMQLGGPSSTIANYFDRGLLFISTEKIAFCSQRSITFNFPVLEHNETVEQFEIPLRSIRASNFGDPHQKIIKYEQKIILNSCL